METSRLKLCDFSLVDTVVIFRVLPIIIKQCNTFLISYTYVVIPTYILYNLDSDYAYDVHSVVSCKRL